MRCAVVVIIIASVAGLASAQPAPADPRQRDAGYIGKDVPLLEIDDCPIVDPALTQDRLRQRGAEHYERGETLYLQGDYNGAVEELVASYCLIPYYTILKDIGQAYERDLEYEKAIGYLERYVFAIKPDAKRASDCAPDPQVDKANVARRIDVLSKLKAHVFVETTPGGATITISNDAGVAARAKSGDTILVTGGRYQMLVEREGYESVSKEIDVKIGKPFTFYVPLQAVKGQLSIQVTPADARIFVGDRFVGIGHYDEPLATASYTITSEAHDQITDRRRVDVLPNQITRVQIELTPQREIGRRQLILYSTVAGVAAGGALLYAFKDTSIATVGTVAGGAIGLAGSYFEVPEDLALGTSSMAITGSLVTTIAGAAGTSVFTDKQELVQPIAGASALIGAAAGYYIGDRVHISPGDAALVNTGVLWGTTAGALFAASFDSTRVIGAGLVLSGLGMGTIGSILLTQRFSISRTHSVLIDVGGVVGVVGGLAAESLIYPTDQSSGAAQEHLADFALGGMAVGLIAAGVLTRDLDEPKVPITPTLGHAVAIDGKLTTTYGLALRW